MVLRKLPHWFITLFVAIFVRAISAATSAWNGHAPPGSTTPAVFAPYYVPPGAKGYDSASPLVSYKGEWSDNFSTTYIHNSARSTDQPGAEVLFTFVGTGIEWFGSLSRYHGLAIVRIDGQPIQEVDTYNEHGTPLRQQRLFLKLDLPSGLHHLKIINIGTRPGSKKRTVIDVDAFVVYRSSATDQFTLQSARPALPVRLGTTPQWSLTQIGSTGIHAMQLAVISDTHALVVDKVEHNPLSIDGHPAWAALYNLQDHSLTPLRMESNSFCAGGTFLSNGTLVNVGGNPVVGSRTSSADFGDVDGLQAIRIFEPCDSPTTGGCHFYENHARIRMASPRWYNTVVRINDGSAMIIGGSKKGGWINNATVNNPTVEYFPPKDIQGSKGMPIHLPFLVNSLSSNLFPIAFSLPDGTIFMAANRDAMIYDWKTNTERSLPQIPNGVRVSYPMTGTALLLPLSPDNNYTPEILLCGGSTVDDTKPGHKISSQEPGSAQCSRMVLSNDGIRSGWQVEQMPIARVMPDAVLLPTGDILIVNGAKTGISGYGNVVGQVGSSNADNPVLTPALYRPRAPAGQRFSSDGLPTSSIPRLYHSVATLTPSGSIMIAGSNPNLDRSEIRYGTEYRVEWLFPPYMSQKRPEITKVARGINFGEAVRVGVSFPATPVDVKVALMDLGYVTHSVHANSRLVYLKASYVSSVLTVQGPPNGNIYPPGPGWLYVVGDGVPSEGKKVMIGDGKSPPIDLGASHNVLESTNVDQYKNSKGDGSASDSE